MPSIQASDFQARFTKAIVDVYRQRSTPTGFLRSFFKEVECPTLEVSIEVQRGKEKVAVDIFRGTDGNRNAWSRSTEKVFIPPAFREYFDATQLQLYDRLYSATSINDGVFAAYVNDVVDHQLELQEKIERAIELQCANVLETGIITNAGTNTQIDYRRKAGSLVDLGAGNYFATTTVDPFAVFEAGCNFLRQVGKAEGGVFNAIMGSQALSDLINNPLFQKRQNLFHMALDMVAAPQRNAVGATLHGEITCGAYKVRLWAYPQFFDDVNGVSTPYVNTKKVTLIPEVPKFKIAYAAVPQLITPGIMPKVGKYVFSEFINQDLRTHKFDVESCPLAIPTAIDTIYTFKAVS